MNEEVENETAPQSKVTESHSKKKTMIERLVMTDGELISAHFPPLVWLVHHTVPSPGLVAISGRPGNYKTWFATWLARCIIGQRPPFAEYVTEPEGNTNLKKVCDIESACLFIENEMSKRQMSTRAQLMAVYAPEKMHWLVGSGANIRDPKWVKWIKEYIKKHKINLMILDPFTAIASMKDENSNAEANQVMNLIRTEFVDSELECTVIFLHHPSKGDDGGKNLRGAGDIVGKCDIHLALEKVDAKERIVRVTYEKTRDVDEAELNNFDMQLRENPETKKLEWIYLGVAKSDWAQKRDQMRKDILSLFEEQSSWSRRDVAKQLNTTTTAEAFSHIWRDLLGEGVIIKKGKSFVRR